MRRPASGIARRLCQRPREHKVLNDNVKKDLPQIRNDVKEHIASWGRNQFFSSSYSNATPRSIRASSEILSRAPERHRIKERCIHIASGGRWDRSQRRSTGIACGCPFGSSKSSSRSSSRRPDRPSLFSLPGLSHPAEFPQLARDAMLQCDSIRRTIYSSLASADGDDGDDEAAVATARRTLYLLDDISNEVCAVIDAAELCRSVHASARWRRAASEAFAMLSEYIGALNVDERLYESLLTFVFCEREGEQWLLSRLAPEERRMARALRKEFERDGIHLQYTQRERARELHNTVVGLESLFSSNITEKVKHYNVEGDSAEAVVRVVPRHVLGQLVRAPCAPPTPNQLTLSSDALLTNTLLAHADSPRLRKQVYMEANTSVPENLDVLDSLIRHRHLHSTLLGYPSYAHRVLSDRMVQSPQEVHRFLDQMQARTKAVFANEMELMSRAKKYVEDTSIGTIEPWDVPFYTTFIKAQRQHFRWRESLANEHADGETESSLFSGYFTVEQSIEGMKVLVQELFGISMKEVDIPPEERWDIDLEDGQEHTHHPGNGLKKFVFHHDLDGPLGTMYFDLHPREGKFVHAAHFTIRCGRIREPDSNDDTKDHHQLPIVALVCNLSPVATPTATHTPLSHSEVETLYHEFGHGLHSLLSRTPFQHLSGTRAAMDFIETPSHLIEHFTRDPSFLSKVLAYHYVTGQHLSERKAHHLAASHNDFRGMELHTQIVHSKFDQALFGTNPCSTALGGLSSTETFAKLHGEAGIPYKVGTHWHSRFGHLVTYGAGYYGYLYAQAFAADIWTECLESKFAFSSPSTTSVSEVRNGGMKIWKEMLIHGGAKDPKKMLLNVLGREPSVDPFFKGMG